jgi:hypothetical protein
MDCFVGFRRKAPRGPNQVWSYDFVVDHCANGQQLKCLATRGQRHIWLFAQAGSTGCSAPSDRAGPSTIDHPATSLGTRPGKSRRPPG